MKKKNPQPWVAIMPQQELLSFVRRPRESQKFAATGPSLEEAKKNLAALQDSQVVNFLRVCFLLRQLYLAGHTTCDTAVLFSLFCHHPEPLTMRTIREETAIARQSAFRSLNCLPHLIQRLDKKETTGPIHDAHRYRLTRLGVETCLNYLKTLLL